MIKHFTCKCKFSLVNRLSLRKSFAVLCNVLLLDLSCSFPKCYTIKGSAFYIFVGNRNVFYYYWSVSNDLVSRAVPICCQFGHLITKLTFDDFLRNLNTILWIMYLQFETMGFCSYFPICKRHYNFYLLTSNANLQMVALLPSRQIPSSLGSIIVDPVYGVIY